MLVSNIEFLESKKETNKENLTVQKEETPVEESNPYEEFGQQLELNDEDPDDLPF